MRSFPSREALVTAYWRKLARFNGAIHSSRTHGFARQGEARTLKARSRRTSRSEVATMPRRPQGELGSNS
jgi:hypothetical protein